MEAASSFMLASEKLRRGWWVFGRIAETGTSSNRSPPTLSPADMSAESPSLAHAYPPRLKTSSATAA